jgi:imidazolonepropionase-like amidohydrolase
MDNSRREIRDGWVAITNGFVSAIGDGAPQPAKQVVDASDCLVTPGLVTLIIIYIKILRGRFRR